MPTNFRKVCEGYKLFSNPWIITVVTGLVVAIVAGIILIHYQELRNKKHQFRVVRATYGKDNKTVDITDILNAKINNNKLDVVLSNDLAGDPIEGITKLGKVKYRLDGKVYEKEYVEMETIRLP